MSANFTDILNKPASAIEAPKPLPQGTYLCMVNGQAEIKKIGQKETLAAIFQLKPLQPQEDVDASALSEQGGIGERTIRHTLFLTEDAAYRAKEFLDHCGLDVEDGSTLGQLIAQTPGKQLLVQVGHRPSQDGTQLYLDIKKTARL